MVIGRNRGREGGRGAGGGGARKLKLIKMHLGMLKDPNPNICGRPDIV